MLNRHIRYGDVVRNEYALAGYETTNGLISWQVIDYEYAAFGDDIYANIPTWQTERSMTFQ